MSNINTIAAFVGGTKRNQIPSLVLAAVTETALPLNTDTGTTAALLAVPLQTAILGSTNGTGVNGNAAILVPPFGPGNNIPDGVNAPYFNSSSFDSGRPFTLRLIGTGSAAANAGNTLSIKIYQGTSATLGSDTPFVTAIPNTFTTVTAATLRFDIAVRCQWDSTSNTLTGVLSGSTLYNGTAALIATATAAVITTLATPSVLSFLPSITWGNAVGGTINIGEWSLEQN
jgi:hypothetical protein